MNTKTVAQQGDAAATVSGHGEVDEWEGFSDEKQEEHGHTPVDGHKLPSKKENKKKPTKSKIGQRASQELISQAGGKDGNTFATLEDEVSREETDGTNPSFCLIKVELTAV